MSRLVFNRHAGDRARNSHKKDFHAITCKRLHAMLQHGRVFTYLFRMSTMLTLNSNAWASDKTSQLMSGQRSELLVCFVVREVLLVETSQHHSASVLAKSSQVTWWCPHDKKANLRVRLQNQFIRLWDPSTRSNKQIVATVWRRNKSRQHPQRLSETHVDSEKETLSQRRAAFD